MRWPRLSEKAKDRLATLARFVVILPMLSLGSIVWDWAHSIWAQHWLRKDAAPVPAVVTGIGPKRLLDYQYTVNGKDYFGKDGRDWEEDRDNPVGVGGRITALVSTSHPSLSCLDRLGSAWIGLPVVVLILIFELFLLGVLVDGILRLVFGIRIRNEEPEDSIAILIFAGAFAIFLALAALALRRNRSRRFRFYFIREHRQSDDV